MDDRNHSPQGGRSDPASASAAAVRGITLFSVGGVAVRIDYSWLLIFALVLASLAGGYFPNAFPGYGALTYFLVGAVATLLFFASVLIHELSHAFVANALGNRVDAITLFVFGGMAHLTEEARTPTNEMKIAGVGPLTSVALAVLFWLVARLLHALGAEPMWVGVFGYLGTINVALAIFNLLPGFPLDGGRLLRAVLWYRSGNLRQATAHAASWGSGIAIGLMVLGALEIFAGALVGGFWLILIGLFLRGAAEAGYHGVVAEQMLAHTRVRDVMVREPVRIPPELTLAQAIDDYFLRYGFGGFPVGDDGQVQGIVSLRQVRECPAEERARVRVGDVMRRATPELAIGPDEHVSDALRRMLAADSGRLLVMERGRLAGLITRNGITRYVRLSSELEAPGHTDEAAPRSAA
ncbi:MAG: site-2 protease family protein [Thermodesulfobacteriota bacterium]